MGTQSTWGRAHFMESSIPVAGAPNSLRDGIHACRMDVSMQHPVQGIQKTAVKQRFDAKNAELSALYGGHMAMRNQMETAILSRHQRLPGLRSHFTGLTTLHNMDEDFGFEDVLDLPDLRESMPASLHDVMEAKLRLCEGGFRQSVTTYVGFLDHTKLRDTCRRTSD